MNELSFYAAPAARACLPIPETAPPLSPGAPALEAMTDLATAAAHVVTPGRQIDEALRDMVALGVRLLLVMDDHDLLGVITASDIIGERPIQFLQDPFASGKPLRHADVTVEDIMTPVAELRPLRLAAVASASVADVAALFRSRPDSHLLVADDGPSGRMVIRGILSRRRLERRLEGHSAGRAAR